MSTVSRTSLCVLILRVKSVFFVTSGSICHGLFCNHTHRHDGICNGKSAGAEPAAHTATLMWWSLCSSTFVTKSITLHWYSMTTDPVTQPDTFSCTVTSNPHRNPAQFSVLLKASSCSRTMHTSGMWFQNMSPRH